MMAAGIETADGLRDEIARLKERRARERTALADAQRQAAELKATRRALLLAEDQKAIAANARALDAAQRAQDDGAAVLSAIDEALTQSASALYERERDTAGAELRDVEAQLADAKAAAAQAADGLRSAQGRVATLTFRQMALIQDAGNDEARRRRMIEEAISG